MLFAKLPQHTLRATYIPNSGIYVGDSYTLTATVKPDNAANKEVTWSSSDKAIASVSLSGTVTGKAKGTATITCTAKDGSGCKATCTINVIILKATGLTLDKERIDLYIGKSYTLTPTITPENATYKNVTWTSDKEDVVEVSSSGVVTAKSAGTAIVTCKATDGSDVSAKCEVKVMDDNEAKIDGIYYILDFEKKTAVVGNNKECQIAEIVIPSSISRDGEDASYSVVGIDNDAFYQVTSLTNINLPNSITDIGNRAFSDCTNLSNFVIPNSVTNIGNYAFWNTPLSSIEIPSSVTNFGIGVFGFTALTSIEIPNSVTNISEWMFAYTPLTSIEIPSSVTSIEDYAFISCSNLTNVDIPNTITLIGHGAFEDCSSLTSVEIPNSVTTIGEDAFIRCKSLISVSIPSSVTFIGGCAFYDCTSLLRLVVDNSNPFDIELEESRFGRRMKILIFENVPTNTCVLYVPKGSEYLYKMAPAWKEFENIVAIGDYAESTDYYLVGAFNDWTCTEEYNFKSNGFSAEYQISGVTIFGDMMLTNSSFTEIYLLTPGQSFACNKNMNITGSGGLPITTNETIEANRIVLNLEKLTSTSILRLAFALLSQMSLDI